MTILLAILLASLNVNLVCDPPETTVPFTLVWEQSAVCPIEWREIQVGPDASCTLNVTNTCLVRVRTVWLINGLPCESASKMVLLEP